MNELNESLNNRIDNFKRSLLLKVEIKNQLKNKNSNIEKREYLIEVLERMRIGYRFSQEDSIDGIEFVDEEDVALRFVELELEYLTKLDELEHLSDKRNIEKIRWKGSPALFGYIFLELIEKGYIEPPLYAGDWNYQGLAKLCFQCFNVNNTTIENLIKEMNPKKHYLSETKKAKFTIPQLSDLA